MNATLPCGTDTARRVHLAHGQVCPVCEPDEQWSARCPLCLDTVTAVGLTIQGHRVSGHGRRMQPFDCPGAGAKVQAPPWCAPVVEVAA